MDELWRLWPGTAGSVSPENPDGAKGGGARATEGTGAEAARELGRGWKVSPSIILPDGGTATLADLTGPGIVTHLWLTTDVSRLQSLTLRMYWDDEEYPAVDVPLGAFFGTAWPELALLDSEMIVVAPAGGLNSYWPMPFHRRARITLGNTSGADVPVYHQISYRLRELPPDAAHLHAAWRSSDPLGSPAVHTLLDGVTGPGQYAGTYLAIAPRVPGWWGEGEIKFYLDGDQEFPTICGTGTEDYFGGAWNFDLGGRYATYSTQWLGLHQVLPPDEIYQPDQRFGAYRWHVRDPVTFTQDLRVTLQALGWQSGGRYLPLANAAVSTTAYWYAQPR
ncbi:MULTISPECIES: glycoside hydrolase family 172 protein [Amycolatopsis]|uniref:DUF2961 domain-containing protein n=2 Tax=Amycolatopsis TaxID=1813 RepID=A0A1I3JRV9_9PSEU|nr:glycoside hydrolase family 172 protein [Amycolatopsis sacchari]SFI62992.1 Protein of unknown function [Amycolatopsis sacchari]